MQTPTEYRWQEKLMRECEVPEDSSIEEITPNERHIVIQNAVEVIAFDMKLINLDTLIENTTNIEADIFASAPTRSGYYAMMAKTIYKSRQVLIDDLRMRLMKGLRNGKHSMINLSKSNHF